MKRFHYNPFSDPHNLTWTEVHIASVLLGCQLKSSVQSDQTEEWSLRCSLPYNSIDINQSSCPVLWLGKVSYHILSYLVLSSLLLSSLVLSCPLLSSSFFVLSILPSLRAEQSKNKKIKAEQIWSLSHNTEIFSYHSIIIQPYESNCCTVLHLTCILYFICF